MGRAERKNTGCAVAMSLPCVISRNGIERTLQIPLDEDGQEKLKTCYEYLHEVIESIR
ncbi:MAG: hypothetical protein ACLTSZ_09130 [Lachnospiraceae bacterium]